MAPQRSRKLSEAQKEDPSQGRQQKDKEFSDSEHESNSESDAINASKDEDEDALDRLVLGDGAGFMAELGRESDEDEVSASEAGLEAGLGFGGGETSLEGVDDADVRISEAQCGHKANSISSYSFSRTLRQLQILQLS